MYTYSAQLVQIHDADTLRLDVDLGFHTWIHSLDVRLYGIDAPELHRADGLGEKARDFVIAWFQTHAGPYVIETHKDKTEKFGRMLAEMTAADGSVLTADLISAGLAKPYTGHGPRPEWP